MYGENIGTSTSGQEAKILDTSGSTLLEVREKTWLYATV